MNIGGSGSDLDGHAEGITQYVEGPGKVKLQAIDNKQLAEEGVKGLGGDEVVSMGVDWKGSVSSGHWEGSRQQRERQRQRQRQRQRYHHHANRASDREEWKQSRGFKLADASISSSLPSTSISTPNTITHLRNHDSHPKQKPLSSSFTAGYKSSLRTASKTPTSNSKNTNINATNPQIVSPALPFSNSTLTTTHNQQHPHRFLLLTIPSLVFLLSMLLLACTIYLLLLRSRKIARKHWVAGSQEGGDFESYYDFDDGHDNDDGYDGGDGVVLLGSSSSFPLSKNKTGYDQDRVEDEDEKSYTKIQKKKSIPLFYYQPDDAVEKSTEMIEEELRKMEIGGGGGGGTYIHYHRQEDALPAATSPVGSYDSAFGKGQRGMVLLLDMDFTKMGVMEESSRDGELRSATGSPTSVCSGDSGSGSGGGGEGAGGSNGRMSTSRGGNDGNDIALMESFSPPSSPSAGSYKGKEKALD